MMSPQNRGGGDAIYVTLYSRETMNYRLFGSACGKLSDKLGFFYWWVKSKVYGTAEPPGSSTCVQYHYRLQYMPSSNLTENLNAKHCQIRQLAVMWWDIEIEQFASQLNNNLSKNQLTTRRTTFCELNQTITIMYKSTKSNCWSVVHSKHEGW